MFIFFFQAEDGIRDDLVTGVQTCALPISDERYKGKLLKITGTIVSISKDFLDKPFLVLSNGEKYSMMGVDIRYSDKDISWLSKLRKGEKVTVKGTCTGMVVGSPQVTSE